MSAETTIQHWKTEIHEGGLSEIKHIHLILWNTGICIAGYNKEQKFVYAQANIFKEKWAFQNIEHFVENTPLLSGAEPVAHIWIADERNILVPKKLFNQNEAELWLEKLHFIDQQELITFNYVTHPSVYIVFPVHQKIMALINDYYPDALIEFLGGNFWHNKHKVANVSLTVLDNYAIVSLFKNQALKNHIQFNFDTIEDIVHKIGSLALHYDIQQDNIVLDTKGIGNNYPALKEELQLYFNLSQSTSIAEDGNLLFQSLVL